MDRIDRAILDQLAGEGRLPNTELAARVGRSPSPGLRRVKALEDAGVVTAYRAVVDQRALGRGLDVLLHIDMLDQRRQTIEAFEAAVSAIDDVVHCRRMFGSPDYLVHVATTDIETYERLYMGQLAGLPGVARTNSQFTMKTVKTTAAFGY